MTNGDGASDEFEQLLQALSFLLKSKHAEGALKILGMGTARDGEYHWRFRMPSGKMAVLKMEVGK